MADRRMFSKALITSDAFTDMSLSAQALYFHLSIQADDDGFVNNPKRIKRMIGASDDDLQRLIDKEYIISFNSGVIVISHWHYNNYIRKDRYKPTINSEEYKSLMICDGKYMVNQWSTNGQPSLGQDRIAKYSLDDEDEIKHLIHNKIDYDYLSNNMDTKNKEIMDEVIRDMIDVYMSTSLDIYINAKESYPRSVVIERYEHMDMSIMMHICDRLTKANITHNASNYIRSTTFRALKSIDTQYTSDIQHGR